MTRQAGQFDGRALIAQRHVMRPRRDGKLRIAGPGLGRQRNGPAIHGRAPARVIEQVKGQRGRLGRRDLEVPCRVAN